MRGEAAGPRPAAEVAPSEKDTRAGLRAGMGDDAGVVPGESP